MQTKFAFQRPAAGLMMSLLLLANGSACTVDRSEIGSYSGAPAAYGILAEKSLDSMADFDLETWGTMLSDSVVYCFPAGDDKMPGKLMGKNAVLAWWKNYIGSSGIKSMSIENASYLPMNVENNVRPGDLQGVQVIAYFSNKMVYETETISLKMNFVIHFDKNRMIDGYYTYYDQTQINKVRKGSHAAGLSLSCII